MKTLALALLSSTFLMTPSYADVPVNKIYDCDISLNEWKDRVVTPIETISVPVELSFEAKTYSYDRDGNTYQCIAPVNDFTGKYLKFTKLDYSVFYRVSMSGECGIKQAPDTFNGVEVQLTLVRGAAKKEVASSHFSVTGFPQLIAGLVHGASQYPMAQLQCNPRD
ncbi:MAG: hypothetical protein EOP09_03645 [Proteobacteria bacterium]|nr:MAG: hypothetical protein EOP09_03645 [Pseudomonadota bacterium]